MKVVNVVVCKKEAAKVLKWLKSKNYGHFDVLPQCLPGQVLYRAAHVSFHMPRIEEGRVGSLDDKF